DIKEQRERQRLEEEYQNRYRSDPNLARYPVKPQKEEQEMRMHAKVSKVRHERRHSDLAINEVGLGPGEGGGVTGGQVPENRLVRRAGRREGERKALLDNHQAYPTDRTVGVGVGGPPAGVGVRSGPQSGGPAPNNNRREPGTTWTPKDKEGADLVRKDSQSSDQSESLRPPPSRSYKSKRGINKRQMSISSSEEEGGSTPEYTSCEDVDMESVSEKGDWDCHPLDPTAWHHPVSWQPSKEGDHLIGRITLSKMSAMPREAGSLLGLKVVGGKMTHSGRLGAFITKVKKGSLADVVGHLRAGDEVLQWNGKSLPGATKKEVYNIILESKAEPQVEIVVSRPIGDIPRIPGSPHPPLESSKCQNNWIFFELALKCPFWNSRRTSLLLTSQQVPVRLSHRRWTAPLYQ
uniref:PDZ domain-containing protein n=1 Tax=Oryzias latipes TaxID=8090 RepID=A0A3P9M7H4_ORYLA